MNPAILTLLPKLADLAGDIFKRKVPDAHEADKLKHEFLHAANQAALDETSEFHEFIVAYEGAGDKVHPALQILRGSVRPVLTYLLVILFGWGFLHPESYSPEQMNTLFRLNLLSMGFWFGERALKNLNLNFKRLPNG